ncbi:SEC10/PgrA surface exclusion domain-containing protein [Streptococcus vestibularis]|uniref:SEC10/PgrA surface exclusion domain-containing protein n=1 Tax=Streptococcus vestibularis TaxID=1343 RepID=UPI00232EC827|nr:SEC10/PgrA surface exclusion domain-containing protein [Streptococcus vestibularis]MDB6217614.1 SEC10/PgrA surface exclusion domain-containing protein [Streptococcus vestibularis]
MNSKKIISSVSLTTAILATGIISQEAHADSVDTTTTTVSQAQSQPVTAEQVASAKASYDTNQEAQAQAQSVVDSKKQALETAKANTTTAQDAVAKAETVAALATDTNIQVAKEAIPTAEAKVQPAKEAVETTKTDVTTKEVSQSQAQEAVNKAQGNVNQAQKAVDEATQIQSEKQTAVDNSAKEVEVAKQGIVDAQATVAEKTDKVSQAGQTVETAKQNDVNLEADTKEAEINVEKADQAAQVAKTVVDTAKVKADETAQALKDAEFNHPTHVVMSDEFKQNFKQYVFGSMSDEDLEKVIASESASRDLNTSYLSTFTDDTTGQKYDVTNLPIELQTELSQYFAYLVNDVRQQLGQPKLVVNTDAIKFATLVAEKYDKNHDPFSGHDNKAINEAAKEMGYWYNRKNKSNAYENLAGNSPDSAYDLDSNGNSTYKIGDKVELTKSELYKLVAENVNGFIYEGSSNGHYGHAISLVKQPSLGIAFTLSHTDFGFGTVPMIETHVLYTPVHDLVNFDKKLLDESKNVPDLVIPDKQAAEVADRAAQAALVTATAQAQTAQTRFEQAKAAYDVLVATPRQTAEAEAKLVTAKAELANAQTALEAAENTLATVTASHADKVAALDMAKASRDEAVNVLTAAQSKLAEANQELAQRETATTVAKAKLAELEQALKDAEQAVIDAKATYEQLVKAKANLETARQAYTQAVTAQEAAQAAYDKAMVVLTSAKAQTALSGTKYTNLKAAYDARIAYEEAQRKSKEEVLRRQAESDAKAKQVRQDVNGTQSNRVNSNTHVGLPEFISSTNEVKTTSFSAVQVATAKATQAVVNRRGMTDYQAPLPQTGESDTAVYLLAGLGMLGLSGVTARKRRG